MKRIAFILPLLCLVCAGHVYAQAPVTQLSDRIYCDGAHKAVKRAAISGATSGNNTLVAAVAGKSIRVIQISFIVAGAVDVRFESGAGGTALTGVMSFPANGGLSEYSLNGLFQTADDALLNMELGGAVQVSGWLSYIEC